MNCSSRSAHLDGARPYHWVRDLLACSFDRWFAASDGHLRTGQAHLSPLYNPLPDPACLDVRLPFEAEYYCPWSPFLFAFLCSVVDPRYASGQLT